MTTTLLERLAVIAMGGCALLALTACELPEPNRDDSASGIADQTAALAGRTTGGAPLDAGPSLERRFRGAGRVVVATVEQVSAAFGRNEHGDNLILTTVTLRVDQRLRGDATTTATFALEGGTVGDLTLEVSDLPTLRPGDHGVFALRASFAGGWVPNGRGLGILRLPQEGIDLQRLRRAEEVSR